MESFRQALLTLGSKLNRTRDAHGAGQALLEAADVLWHWDAASLDVVTATDPLEVRSVLNVDIIGGERREVVGPQPRRVTSWIRRVIERGAELIEREEASELMADAIPFGDTGRHSACIMSVPIRREASVVGILSIHSYSPHAYTTDDLQVLLSLANYCSGALDRIRAEDAQRLSEERYRHLIESSFDWIWEVDANGRYTYASPKVIKLLGYEPREVLGRTPFELMPEAEAKRGGRGFSRHYFGPQAFFRIGEHQPAQGRPAFGFGDQRSAGAGSIRRTPRLPRYGPRRDRA